MSTKSRPCDLIVLVITCMFTTPQSARFGLGMTGARIGLMGPGRDEALDCDHYIPRYSSRVDRGFGKLAVVRDREGGELCVEEKG